MKVLWVGFFIDLEEARLVLDFIVAGWSVGLIE